MNIFLDTEFTGLHQNTTLLSLALLTDNNRFFYAEFTDYDENCEDWIKENIISKLKYLKDKPFLTKEEWDVPEVLLPFEEPSGKASNVEMKGNTLEIKNALVEWLEQFKDEELVVWASVPHYDWVLFCELFGGALNIPKNFYYIPNDFSTLLRAVGKDPDLDLAEYAGVDPKTAHNALEDVKILKTCFNELRYNTYFQTTNLDEEMGGY